MSQLLLAYYGDDFTGSTDALECLANAGVPTVLFIEPPTPEQMTAYAHVKAIGVAGRTRSLPTDELDAELRIAFPAMQALGSRHVHYKICSTFDSSTEIGSIGRAIDVGSDVFGSSIIPLVVGAPGLGRYCAFGNLFARMGIGSEGAIHRLDRHPATRNHPITPATESDLRLVLKQQTDREIRLFDLLMNESPDSTSVFRQLIDASASGASCSPVVLFDAIYTHHLKRVGELLDPLADDGSLFSVGSSAIESALVDYWQATGVIEKPRSTSEATEVDTLLVLSGSCSPVTEAQIDWALTHGWAEVALDTVELLRSPEQTEAYINTAGRQTLDLLSNHPGVIVHTGRGPNDPRLKATRQAMKQRIDHDADVILETNQALSSNLAQIGLRCLQNSSLKRICVAGGDTSSYVARSMRIESLEMTASVCPGAPLCRAKSPGIANGIEFNFKGGQVGGDNYFESVRTGAALE